MTMPTVNDVQAVEPILTNLLIGYQQADVRFVATRVFPGVPVVNDSGTFYIFTKKYYFHDDLEVRAPGGGFAGLDLGVSTDTYKTLQYAGEVSAPDEVQANSQIPFDIFQAKLKKVSQSSMIRKEVAFAAAAMVTGVWGTDDDNSTTDWDDTTSGDPVADVNTAMMTVANNTGYDPNTMVIGYIVRNALVQHPDIIDRIKYVQAAVASNIDAALSQVLGLNVLVARATYSNTNEAATFSATAIIDDDALICHVGTGSTLFDATSGKTLFWQPGGGLGSIYRDPARRNHSDVAQHKEQWVMKVTASDMGYFFADVV